MWVAYLPIGVSNRAEAAAAVVWGRGPSIIVASGGLAQLGTAVSAGGFSRARRPARLNSNAVGPAGRLATTVWPSNDTLGSKCQKSPTDDAEEE